MKTIYFVRHGESESNATKVMRGPEAELTEKGVQQAERVATRFRTIEHNLVVSSAYPRALNTARAIAKVNGREPIVCDYISERIHPRVFIGKSVDDSEKRGVEHVELSHWSRGQDYKYSDEETFSDLHQRAARAQVWFDERHEERIVAVTHGTFLRFFQAYLLFGDALTPDIFVRFFSGLKTSNAGITMYEVHEDRKFPWDIRWKLRTWMDIAHLGD